MSGRRLLSADLEGRAGGTAPPRTAATVVDLLRERVETRGDERAYTFLLDGEEEGPSWTWAQLERSARAIAGRLQRRLPGGERALLLYPPGLDFIAAFFGCLFAGVLAVPAYPPRGRRPLDRLRPLLRDARPRLALTTEAEEERVRRALAEARDVEVLATDTLEAGAEAAWRAPRLTADDLAFLQYTSGSTAEPRGVMVRHGNLLHNQEMIRRAFGSGPETRVVGWLPLYHDMGLIGNVLQPLYLGVPCVLMAPLAFLQRPARWLRAISRYRATLSGGPSFAYELCAQRVGARERRGLDLASWRLAFNGAEPVRAATLERFAETFAPCGFRRRSFYPCYGLAEATLLVSGGEHSAEPVVLEFEAEALEQDRLVEREEPVSGDGAPGRRLVACGHARLGQELAVVDPATGRRLEEGRVGEIWIAGASVAAGYWRRPEESRRVFGARLDESRRSFLRTGDLGCLRGGELFVTGRLKDLIILRGRNFYPQDFEASVEGCHPALRPGGCAAFAVETEEGEGLVVVAELERRGLRRSGEALEAIRRALADEHEARAWEVVLVGPGAVAKTSSGKVRRGACRAAYLRGALAAVARSGTETTPGKETGDDVDLDRDAWRALPAAERRPRLRAFLARRAARAARLEPEPADGEPQDAGHEGLGLDSLAAAELKDDLHRRLGVEVPIARLLGGGSLEALAAEVEGLLAEEARAPFPPPEPLGGDRAGDRAGDHPLSHGQRALWLAARLADPAPAYNLAVALRVEDLDAGALAAALGDLSARHPALRTTFPAPGGEPVARLHERLPPEVRLETPDREPAPERLAEEARRRFDLARGPLLRAAVFRPPRGAATLVLTVHHLAADLRSLAVLQRELGTLYRQHRGGDAASLGPVSLSPADVARWEHCRFASGAPEAERLGGWWRRRLAGAPGILELPTDRPRPRQRRHRGLRARVPLAPALGGELEALARRRGGLFPVLLAAFQLLLHRYSSQETVLVGSPTAGRGRRELRDVVGYLVNPVVLRGELGGGPSVAELLERARDTAYEAFEHQAYPFPLLVSELAEEASAARDAGRTPLFQAMLVFQRAPGAERGPAAAALGEGGAAFELGGLRARTLPLELGTALYDLSLLAAPGDRGLRAVLEADRDLFDATTVARMAGHLCRLLAGLAAALAAGGAQAADRLPLLSAAERAQLGREQEAPRPRPASTAGGAATLDQLFQRQAERLPEAIAVVCGAHRLSYRELARRASHLARRLRRLGVGPEVPVAVCAERRAELVVGLLAVLEAGGAYVPLDPDYPRERLAWMLDDAQGHLRAPVLLTQRHLAGRLPRPLPNPTTCEVFLDEVFFGSLTPPAPLSPPPPHAQGHLAYLIYTSGSTGRPKGVAIEHRSAVALVSWAAESFAPRELAAVLASTSICFDLSVFELFAPLAAGGAVVLADSILELPRLPAAAEVSLLSTIPSALAELLRGGRLPAAVRALALAGEPLRGELVRRAFERSRAERVLNLYGPSEDTTYSTFFSCPPPTSGAGREPTLGRPVAGSRAHVVRPGRLGGEPEPLGVAGELLLGGDGLARGYWRRPARTAERFVPDPYTEGRSGRSGRISENATAGSRLYRTGDRARRLAGGELEYLGRLDQQVKLRGFRIEPGEVEAVLGRHPAVAEAAVVAWPAPARLVAHVAAEPGRAPSAGELRAFLAERLPAYMLPASFERLDALPRTPNGKVDRRALRERESPRGTLSAPPRGPLEELLAGFFAQVLAETGIETRAENGAESAAEHTIGRDDDFFTLGGHSLLAARLAARLEEALGLDLAPSAVFEAPTVAALARRIEARIDDGGPSLPPLEPGGAAGSAPHPLTSAQERICFFERLAPGTPLYHLAAVVGLHGRLDAGALERALAELLARHPALRTAIETGEDGELRQRVMTEVGLELPAIDLRRLEGGERRRTALELARAAALRPFELARAPLVRARRLCLDDQESLLALTLHHAIADGASLEIVLSELAAGYCDLAAGRRPRFEPLAASPADAGRWQRGLLGSEALEAQLAYWQRHLQGSKPAASARPAGRTPIAAHHRGGLRSRRLEPTTTERLEAACRRRGATLFMGLLAAFAALLGRIDGGREVVLATPAAGRRHRALEGVVGCFVNLLALRLDLGGRPGFEGLLARARAEVLAAFRHQDAPFERVVERLRAASAGEGSERGPELGGGLFRALLSLQQALPAREAAGLCFEPAELELGVAKFDLTLVAERRAGGLALAAEYRADRFEASAVERLLGHLERLLAAALEAPEAPIAELPILSPGERHQLLVEWNDGPDPRPAAAVHRLIARGAERWGDRPAVMADDGGRPAVLSYGGLLGAARSVAVALGRRGAGAGSRVGLCLDRGLEAAAGLLGVLEAGAAYLPLTPETPRGRLRFMARDAGLAAVVSRRALRGVAAELAAEAGCPLILTDDLEPGWAIDPTPAVEPTPDALAYLLYTSGSSGRPKPVAVPHRALGHLAAAAAEAYSLGDDDRVLQFAPLGFDLAVEELFPTWLAGAAVVLWDDRRALEPRAFFGWARRQRLSVLNLSASYWRELVYGLEEGASPPPGLRLLVTGNEPVPRAVLERWLRVVPRDVAWRNAYGMTEAAVTSTVGGVPDDLHGDVNGDLHGGVNGDLHDDMHGGRSGDVPVGRPLGATRLYLLDAGGLPLPIGARGEVSLAGPGLAWGYPGDARRTATVFVPDAYSRHPGARRYRSGDLGRLRGDGTLGLLGRADRQVKVRGMRVEPAEVEAVLAAQPGVAEAAAGVASEGAGARLFAFWVAAAGAAPAAPTAGELRRVLRRALPEAMVPATLGRLAALPRTPSGKIDGAALAALAATEPAPGGDAPPEPPLGKLEERLAVVFAETLGRGGDGSAGIGRNESFFDLGGHSLLALHLLARLRHWLGLELPLAQLFATPTVAGLAAAIAAGGWETAGDGPAAAKALAAWGGVFPAAFSQERLFFLDRLAGGSPFYNLAGAYRLLGRLDAGALDAALGEVVRRHGALRTTLGFEGGGVIQKVVAAHVTPSPAARLAHLDLSALPIAVARRRALALAQEAARRPFDLGRGPLLRTLLLRLGAEEHLLAVVMHHAIGDARSLEVFAAELAAGYRALAAGRPLEPRVPALQYADYALWQHQQLRGAALEALVGFWRKRLEGAPAVLELPADRPRPSQPRFLGAALPWALDERVTGALAALGRGEGATLFMTLAAAFELLLGRLAGRRSFLFGTDVANRRHAETEGAIGFFVNSLVLRSELPGGGSFRDLLARVRRSTLEAFDHQELPFHRLVEALRPERAANRNPLFQVMLILQTTPLPRPRLGALRLESLPLEETFSVFDLSVSLELTESGGLEGSFRYSTELFEAARVEGWMAAWSRLLGEVAERPDAPLESFGTEGGRGRRRRIARLGEVVPRAVEVPGAKPAAKEAP